MMSTRQSVVAATALTILAASAQGLLPVSASAEASPEASNRPACVYQVTKGNPGVYEKPTRISTLLKRKRPPAKLDSTYCMRYKNEEEDRWYVSVDIKKAQDDIGWIRADRVIRIR